MANYIKYDLGDGLTLMVEADEASGGVVQAGVGVGDMIVEAKSKFADALEGVKQSAILLRRKLADLQADAVEVEFGLKTTGELGNFAVGKVSLDANYKVTLKWENKPSAR